MHRVKHAYACGLAHTEAWLRTRTQAFALAHDDEEALLQDAVDGVGRGAVEQAPLVAGDAGAVQVVPKHPVKALSWRSRHPLDLKATGAP